jgi:NhaP-type Na+/H+ or K+/H+ antiporter
VGYLSRVSADLVFLLVGISLLLAVVLPKLLSEHAVSAPMVLLVVGMLIGLLPLPDGFSPSPLQNRAVIEHLTEFTVIVALMGVGLALDRPLLWHSPRTWKRWGATWRLLVLGMPLAIAGVAFLGWWVMGLAPAGALLLGAVLAPTDPVLASDVQVSGPTAQRGDEEDEEIDEDDEVRFALTSEAGLNDGLAFPFVYAAISAASLGAFSEWGLKWFAWELVGKVVIGVVIGVIVGWLLAKLAFRSPMPSLRLAETGEPLLAVAAVLLAYGAAEVAGGYGFLAVFAGAMTLRSAERGHDYHAHMHESIDRLERLLTLIVLLLLGVALTNRLFGELSWQGIVVGAALIFVVRPLTARFALWIGPGRDRVGDKELDTAEQRATSFFGVRGVGSLYYLAYAAGHAEFAQLEQLWATVGFTIALSVLVHGVTATPVMKRLDRAEAERR